LVSRRVPDVGYPLWHYLVLDSKLVKTFSCDIYFQTDKTELFNQRGSTSKSNENWFDNLTIYDPKKPYNNPPITSYDLKLLIQNLKLYFTILS
jgi:hypothetical protein